MGAPALSDMKCFNCSQATLYLDGALRCDLDMHLAIMACVWQSPGKFKLYKKEREISETKPRIVKSKVQPKAVKKQKPKLQGRMFE